MMKLPRFGLLGLWCLLPAAPLVADGERRSANDALFDQSAYHARVAYLASDELEGRGTGQPGIDRAAEYIADFFHQCGVRPAGDDGTFFQNFTLKIFRRIAHGTQLKYGVDGNRPTRRLELDEEFIPFPFSRSGRFRGDVVFVGYGIVDGDLGYDDYDGIDVTDKVLLMLRRAPRFAEFGIRDMSFRAKASRADLRDAAAVLVVNPTFDEAGDALFDFDGAAGSMGLRGGDYGLPMLHVTRRVADMLLEAGGLPDLETLEARIDESKAHASAPLEGVSVRGRVNIEMIESPARNVVGLIPGTGPQKDEIVVLGAHYDHLGITNKGSDDFDSEKDISNGADDNASGTALVMTLADAFSRGQPPNRSILLALFTGEERGLLGSARFARHPTVDLENIVAMFNFDMVGRLRNSRLHVAGMKTGEFEPMVRLLASSHGIEVKDGGGGRGPSDHTHFYNKDIPVLFFHTGLHKEYHRPEDDTGLVNFDGAIRVAKFAADVLDEIDAAPSRPAFHEDNRRDRVRLTARDRDEEKQDKKIEDPAEAIERAAVTSEPESGDGRADDLDELRREIQQELSELTRKLAGKGKANPISEAEAMLNESRRRELKEQLLTLQALATELQVDMLGKKRLIDALNADQAESIPPREIEQATRNYLGAQSELLRVTEQVFETRAELKEISREIAIADSHEKYDEFERRRRELARLEQLVDNLPLYAQTARAFSSQFDSADVVIRFSPDSAAPEFEVVVRSGENRRERPRRDRAPAAPGRESAPKMPAQKKPAADDMHENHDAKKDNADDPHADAPDDVDAVPMPPVRLGIMPSYGETEGEGYELTGVVEDGPAAKAGMKDDDRIYKIGDKLVTDIYTYMDALQRYKPGDEVPVTVIRDGKKVLLKIKAAKQKSQEAA